MSIHLENQAASLDQHAVAVARTLLTRLASA
jgi:hypothetical protein